ncbi:hypothetical protein MSAN_01050100 [Mycena sanguinolenta]|uniref:Uncharacterized protein n=1 Tax=Mycena sanguinolenta TaxID=230812 RepID=A0A8H6YU44_9AGAR|nr:hypothetical protein MSAN_01050100 [Mycena sanguinolenta]
MPPATGSDGLYRGELFGTTAATGSRTVATFSNRDIKKAGCLPGNDPPLLLRRKSTKHGGIPISWTLQSWRMQNLNGRIQQIIVFPFFVFSRAQKNQNGP